MGLGVEPGTGTETCILMEQAVTDKPGKIRECVVDR